MFWIAMQIRVSCCGAGHCGGQGGSETDWSQRSIGNFCRKLLPEPASSDRKTNSGKAQLIPGGPERRGALVRQNRE